MDKEKLIEFIKGEFTSLMTLFTSLRNFGEDMDLGDLDDDLI